ncbi:MAG: NAD(P)/FAD-dependent oxidoreductase [Coriobacteriia bacterium]|nr:NAD(P)/FAD-dependent oxidoreductase [Coriobacteriia bacterium]
MTIRRSSTGPVVAIIGYGVAGVNTLIALRGAGYQGKIRVFSDIDTLPYSPILTSYYVGGEKTFEECFPWCLEELGALDAEVMNSCRVVELDPEKHVIRTTEGIYTYTKCVIASGATPMNCSFTDASEYEPLVLRTMKDAARMKAAITKPDCERVLVSGASMVALKALEACLNQGLKCTLVGMSSHVLDFNALPKAAMRFEKGLRNEGVQLRLGQVIKAVKEKVNPNSLTRRRLEVTFSSGETEVFDEIIVAHGMRCNLDFVQNGSFEMGEALLVDGFMRTSDPDVYAAGDVAQATELISGKKRIVGNWKNAAVQGACAGRAIASELAGDRLFTEKGFIGSIPTNTIAVKDTLFNSAGTMEVTSRRYVREYEDDDMLILSIFQEEADGTMRLVGFNLVCNEDIPGSKAYETGAMLTQRIKRFESSVDQTPHTSPLIQAD